MLDSVRDKAGSAVVQVSVSFVRILLIDSDGMCALHFYGQKTNPGELLVLPVKHVHV